MAGVLGLGIIIIEALLAGAFALGFYWLGGWHWGVVFAAVLLLLMALPWVGELKLVFDSVGPKGGVKVGWWGKASFAVGKDATRVILRVMGIPIRRRIERGSAGVAEPEAGDGEAPPEFEPAAAEGLAEESAPEPEEAVERTPVWKRIDSEVVEGFCRVVGSAMGATCELVWGAEEIRVVVEDPAEREVADSIIEEVFGRREVGPADVSICRRGDGRRVRVVYRIGLLRAALAGLQVVIDGRAVRFVRMMKKRDRATETGDEDERIIEQIVEQAELCEEDED
jgi:hypothetical protein